MVNAQEYIEENFPKDVSEIKAISKGLVGHLDLSEYLNLTEVDFGVNPRLISLKLAPSNKIARMGLFETGINDFSFLASIPNMGKNGEDFCLPFIDRHKSLRDTQIAQVVQDINRTKNDQLKEKDDQLKEKDNQLTEKDNQLKEKDDQLKEKDDQLKEKDNQLNLFRKIQIKKTQLKKLLSNLNPQNDSDTTFWLNELIKTQRKISESNVILENIQSKLLKQGIIQEQITELRRIQKVIIETKRQIQLVEVGQQTQILQSDHTINSNDSYVHFR